MKTIALLAFFSAVLMINAKLPSSTYIIKSTEYGTNWDVCSSSSLCGGTFGNIFNNPSYSDEWQQFIVTALPSGFYTIKSYSNNLFVTAAADSGNPIDTLFLSAENSSPSQQFAITSRPDGSYFVKPREASYLAFEAPSSTFEDLYLATKGCSSTVQRFIFQDQNLAIAMKSLKSSSSPRRTENSEAL